MTNVNNFHPEPAVPVKVHEKIVSLAIDLTESSIGYPTNMYYFTRSEPVFFADIRGNADIMETLFLHLAILMVSNQDVHSVTVPEKVDTASLMEVMQYLRGSAMVDEVWDGETATFTLWVDLLEEPERLF